MANELKIKNGLIVVGNEQVTGSLSVSQLFTALGGITSSLGLFGTASNAALAQQAISASFASTVVTASFATNAGLASTASFASAVVTASFATNAGTAATASFATSVLSASILPTNQTGSFFLTFVTASGGAQPIYITSSLVYSPSTNQLSGSSLGITASLSGNASTATTASFATTVVTASYANNAGNAGTASFALVATSASFSTSGSYAVSASSAATASFSFNTYTASFLNGNVTSASFAGTAYTASNIVNFPFDNSSSVSLVTASSNVVLQRITGSFLSVDYNYVLYSGSNLRVGSIFGGWLPSGSAPVYAEYVTTDIGDTSQVSMSIIITGSQVALISNAATSFSWSLRTLATYL